MFGQYVQQLRKGNGVGSRELSRSIHKAETYISQLERGLIKSPEFETAKLILRKLNVPEHHILDTLSAYAL